MAKFVVCPECDGEGTLGPGFVYTQADREEQFDGPDEFADHIEDIRNGVYDSPCGTCKGQRVVVDIEEFDGETTTAAQRWQMEREYRAEVAAEQRYFGYY